MQNWCARCRYDGKAEFVAGTFMVRSKAPLHEVEAEALAFLGSMLPATPRIVALVPGCIWFQAAEDDRVAA
jgi:hypothetical protein